MFFGKRNHKEIREAAEGMDNLNPVLHVIDTLKDYHKDVVKKEVDSLWELNEIRRSFGGVLKETENFQGRLQDFEQNFSSIEQVSGEFAAVRDTIIQSVTHAQNGVEELKSTSEQVAAYFSEMEQTFDQLQESVKGIRQCINKIVSIADETNILAINASIEASRAGQDGKGFAVVASKVKELAEEIKSLANDADSGIHNVESGATELNDSILSSAQKLGEGTDIVNSAYDSFHEITQAAEGASQVQTEISNVIEDSQKKMQTLCQFFDEIKLQYQEVVKHIKRASSLGTTKSAMFEDIDNMLSQIPPIIKDYTSK